MRKFLTRNRRAAQGRWPPRITPEPTAALGCYEVHAVVFQPLNDGVGRDTPAVGIQIPEIRARHRRLPLERAEAGEWGPPQ
jgi:hypothetical protein